ncbi:hypothetical protein [Limimaricola sp.]|uniref:hypothetical protein n=1 Tax=Limimaricola sp. TaxID=2211665 RepID=UPI0025C16EA4|nr:hypothetical protein [Limimaricola sp.]
MKHQPIAAPPEQAIAVRPAEARVVPGPRPASPAQPLTAPAPTRQVIAPPVGRARPRPRHRVVLATFVMLVLLPSLAAGLYLWRVAAPQYASTVGFSIRKEDAPSAVDLLGGFASVSGSSASDADMLYEFLRSQQLVTDIDAQVDLRQIWSRPTGDPVFAYHAPGTVEDLLAYWRRMVAIRYESRTGLIEVRVLAFDPADARRIASAIFDKSTTMINDLNSSAREDAIRYARSELSTAVERLKQARQAVTAFRNANQMVDPSADIQSQASLLGVLQNQLASAMIELDLLQGTVREGDLRMVQARRKVTAIEDRITAEKARTGAGPTATGDGGLATLVGDYERLSVDRDFAERSYVSALAAYDGAVADAQRKSRYLATYVAPTLAQKAEYPRRSVLLGGLAGFLFLSWSLAVLMIHSLRDRR